MRSKTCINTPASASVAPVPNAASARGSRNFSTMSRASGSGELPKAAKRSGSPAWPLPTLSAIARAPTVSTDRTSNSLGGAILMRFVIIAARISMESSSRVYLSVAAQTRIWKKAAQGGC